MRHTSKPATWLASLAFLSLCPPLPAQSSAGSQNAQTGMNPGGTVTTPLQVAVTGCLKRGNEGAGYFIADQNGTRWKLVPNGVNLAEHINHSVMVTGKPVTSDAQADNEQGVKTKEDAKPQPSLRVLTIKMLSPSCTR